MTDERLPEVPVNALPDEAAMRDGEAVVHFEA